MRYKVALAIEKTYLFTEEVKKRMKNKKIHDNINIYLVRHGEAANSWAEALDSPLSELGKQQAKAVSRSFGKSPIAIISSPMLRAKQTAAPLAQIWGVSVKIDDCFIEIPSDSEEKDRKKWLQQIFEQKWNMVNSRIKEWREKAFEAILCKKSDVIIFTHFMLINAVISKIKKTNQLVFFSPDNASITHLKITNERTIKIAKLGREKKTVVN
jgi:broad specificity phosphatase PhoE